MSIAILIPVYRPLCDKCGYLHREMTQFGKCYKGCCPAKVLADREKKH